MDDKKLISIEKVLFSEKKVTCSLDRLKELIVHDDYDKLAQIITILCENEILSPVKASKRNGMVPPLYNRYRIHKKTSEDPAMVSEIRSLHHMIDTEVFINDHNKYLKYRRVIITLDGFLKLNPEGLWQIMSENERAYQIWGDEKTLDNSENISLLKECGVWDKLNTYPTPEPFFSYSVTSDINDILVIENKDTWFSLRERIREEGRCTVFGKHIDCIIYGEGNKITKSGYSLTKFLQTEIRYSGKVWYWGDIDHAGIEIFLKARRLNQTLDIMPLSAAYTVMVDLFKERLNVPNEGMYKVRTTQKRPDEISNFYFMLSSPETAAAIDDILLDDMYIPQEIVNYPILQRYVRRR